MFLRKEMNGTIGRITGAAQSLMAAAIVAAMTVSTVLVPAAVAQTAKPPKDGLYLYVCLPGNIQGDTTQGGDGLLVLNVDKNYEFVERIALPFAREGTQGDCKGIDASVQLGLIYPMLIDRAIAIDLETSTVLWQKLYDGGCCDRGVVSPYGETLWQAGNGFNAWYVTSALNGELIETIKDWPGNRAHNTIMSPRGDQILLSP